MVGCLFREDYKKEALEIQLNPIEIREDMDMCIAITVHLFGFSEAFAKNVYSGSG